MESGVVLSRKFADAADAANAAASSTAQAGVGAKTSIVSGTIATIGGYTLNEWAAVVGILGVLAGIVYGGWNTYHASKYRRMEYELKRSALLKGNPIE